MTVKIIVVLLWVIWCFGSVLLGKWLAERIG